MRRLIAFLLSVAMLGVPATAVAAGAALPKKQLYKNCTNLNKKYPHGLGRAGARDRTSGDSVMNFTRSTKLYNEAMSYNRGLDRDKDGVACEKA